MTFENRYRSINRTMNMYEDHLILWAIDYPIIPGLVHIGMGVVQEISAIATLIFGVLSLDGYLVGNRNAKIIDKAWTHMKHGIGNIVSGFFGTIPFFNWYFRGLTNNLAGPPCDGHAYAGYTVTDQWYVDKFMYYPYVEQMGPPQGAFSLQRAANYFTIPSGLTGLTGRVNAIPFPEARIRSHPTSYTML